MFRCVGLAFLVFYPGQIIGTVLLLAPIHLANNPVLSSRSLGELGSDLGEMATLMRDEFPFTALHNLNWVSWCWFCIVLTIGFKELYRVKWHSALLSIGFVAALFVGSSYLVAFATGR